MAIKWLSSIQCGTVFSLNLKLQFRERGSKGISPMAGYVVFPAGFFKIKIASVFIILPAIP